MNENDFIVHGYREDYFEFKDSNGKYFKITYRYGGTFRNLYSGVLQYVDIHPAMISHRLSEDNLPLALWIAYKNLNMYLGRIPYE
jgi:hypothetical protein